MSTSLIQIIKISVIGLIALIISFVFLQLSYRASSYDNFLPFIPISSFLILYLITLIGFIFANKFNVTITYGVTFKRFYISICLICFCIFLMSLGLREISFVAFIFLLCSLCLWLLTGKFIYACRLLFLIFLLLALSPFDLRVASPYTSTYKKESYVGWLDVRYGLIQHADKNLVSKVDNAYTMGCLVPIYPLSKIYYVDLWPSIDLFFNKINGGYGDK